MKKIFKLYNRICEYSDYYFLLGWILMIINTSLYYSNVGSLDFPILSLISIILFGLKYLTTRYSKREILIVIISNFLGLLMYFYSHEMRLLWFSIVVCSSKDIDVKKIAKYSFITILLCVFVYLFLFFVGFIDETITIKGGHSLGLGHPNGMHLYLTLLISIYIYLNFDKFNYKTYLFFNIINILVFLISQSRSGALTLFVILLYPLILSFLKNVRFKRLFTLCFLTCIISLIVLVIVVSIFYNESTFLDYINQLFTGRLSQAHFYFENYGITIFGQYLEYLNNPDAIAILDIGYMKLLINNGIFSLVLFVLGYALVLIKAIRHTRYDIILLISTVLVHLLIENTMTYIFMNVSLLYFGCLLFQEEDQFV